MNKILIALVLAVVMGGNAYAKEVNIYCDSINEGYTFTSGKYLEVQFFDVSSDKIKSLLFHEVIWSPDYVSWEGYNGYWRIDRKTIGLEYKKDLKKNYYFYSQCSLVDQSYRIRELIYKKRAEITKGNKF